MKKTYEEPSFDLTIFHFGRIMEDAGEELVHTSIVNPGAGGGNGGGLE